MSGTASALSVLPELAGEVFVATYGAPTRAQALAWPAITRGRSVLVVAPTGSGKTLAAFYAFLGEMLERPGPGPPARATRGVRPTGGVEIVYVSPLKALASDIERNLRAPLAALEEAARRRGREPAPIPVAVRTGDTPTRERAALQRRPPRVLVTTPESLYLVLTSPRAREGLRTVRAVIVDEVHAVLPTKRGVHLALTLERLEALAGRRLQRVGLSATVAPVEEAARWLGGMDDDGRPRAVDILDAGGRAVVSGAHGMGPPTPEAAGGGGGERAASSGAHGMGPPTPEAAGGGREHLADPPTPRPIDLRVVAPADPAVVGPRGAWPPIAAELVRLIDAHRSTLVFCNNRRLAERITGLVNDTAGRPLALAHHGSVSRERRALIEERLKAGELRAVVATGSLELGIDVGSVECVVQLQSPKAVSRALQRIGRSGHHVGGTPRGRIIGTSRGDFLEAAAIARGVLAGEVEATRSPTRCLDVLAQQLVAEVAARAPEAIPARELLALARRAWPYRELAWEDAVAVLDMLAGRTQGEALRDLRPRLDWDRRRGLVTALPGTRAQATARPGAIPDRGTFRVEHAETGQRLGELDEEFVFESRVGEVFVLGATSWRIARVLRDRVLVRPAPPGEPAKMPFWRGEGLGRTVEAGRRLGALVRELAARLRESDDGRSAAIEYARSRCALDEAAARIVVDHVASQVAATGVLPDDRTIIVELHQDPLGDARVALLSPFGGRVHAAWAIAIAAEARRRLGLDVPHLATDDGILFRLPSGDAAERLLGAPRWLRAVDVPGVLDAEIEGTPLYAGLFREAAQRSLLLPARGRGGRTPLWLARLRAADVAQLLRGHPHFPIAREARREALEDVLDVRALVGLISALERGELVVATVRRQVASPFASQLELAFTMSLLYERDAPRLERRARALAAGPEVAGLLLPPEELEELLEPEAVRALEASRQQTAPGTRARTPEELADVLRRLGGLSDDELVARYDGDGARAIAELWRVGRAIRWARPGRTLWILDEDAALWEDLDDEGPAGRAARAELVRRSAATRGPFAAGEVALRLGLGLADVERALEAAAEVGAVVRGRFVRGGGETWCDRRNLAEAHRRTLHLLRDRGAPAKTAQLAAYLLDRHRGADVGAAVQLLAGAPAPREVVERDLLWSRVSGYHPSLLDAACAAGDVAWWLDGGKLVVTPRADAAAWAPEPSSTPPEDDAERAVLEALDRRGALFGPELVGACRLPATRVFPAVWALARRGLVTNDAFEALRRAAAYDFDPARAGLDPAVAPTSVRKLAALARRSPWVGRFSRVPAPAPAGERTRAQAVALVRRYGVVGKALVDAEGGAARWAELEEVFRGLELRGEVVRGYFVEGLGAYQVALAEAVDDLRAARDPAALALVSACDPICPYGTLASEPEVRSSRLPSNYLVLRGGAPLLVVEAHGKRIFPVGDPADDVVVEGLRTLRGLLAAPLPLRGVRAVTVHTFGEREAASAETLFARAGFERDYDRMVLAPR